MTHPSISCANAAIVSLRALETEVELENDTHIVPDVYVSWDAGNADIGIRAKSGTGDLLTLEASVSGAPSWFSLDLGLGAGKFGAGDVLGLVLEVGEGTPFGLDVRVLSSDNGTLHWTELSERPMLDGKPGVVVLLHTLTAQDPMTAAETFHTLVLNLPRKDFRLAIKDMRFFVLDAARGLRSTPETLTSYAV